MYLVIYRDENWLEVGRKGQEKDKSRKTSEQIWNSDHRITDSAFVPFRSIRARRNDG